MADRSYLAGLIPPPTPGATVNSNLNLFDLPPEGFRSYLNELAAQGVNTDELMRQYRRANSPFSGLFDWAINSERDIANEGRTTAGAGLLSKEAGTTGMDALASARIEPTNFIAGLLSGGAQAVDAAGATLRGLVPAADMPMEALGTAGMAMTGGAAVPKPRGALGANSLLGGGMSDPTQTGWTFRDVKIPQFNREQNRRINEMFGRLQWREAELPIRSMYATQDRVNPDFATTTSSQELVPTVVKYNNEYFVRDGHHRLTRAAEEGRQTANVAIIDLDNTDTSAPLLDYKALSLDEINAQKNEMNSILDQLFGDMSDADIEALANSRTTSANRDATTGAIASAAANGGGFNEYLRRVNPQGYRVDANDRPNLMMGDMYGMLPRNARKVGERDGVSFYQAPDGASYATAFNPDVGEMDVVGYAMPRGDMTDLAVVNEMQGRGIGSELQYLMRSQDPYALTGGLTEAGEASLRRTYNRLRDEGIVSANRDATTGAIALPAARNEAERMARQILEMRAAGRAGEVTDAMMAQADPQYMFNNTPLPMDEASRMARAGEMGFDARIYHGSQDDITSMDPLKGSTEGGAGTLFSSDEPRVANTYATGRYGSEGENVIPLFSSATNYGESGYKTPFPASGSDADIERWMSGLERFNRSLDNSKTSYFENAIQSARNAGRSGAIIRQVEDDASQSMMTMPSDVYVTLDPTTIRSRFARFDPAFSHLANLNAANASPLAGILAMPNEEERNRQLGLLFGGYR